MDIVIIGVLLGGAYALMAMGLQLQYGVAKIMNLANGEMLVAGSFAAFWFFTSAQVSPLLAILVVAPMAFIFNWLVYKIFMRYLVKKARSEGQLEVNSILSTFGQSFILVGLMLALFGGEYFSYSYLEKPYILFGQPYELNRIVAFLFAIFFCCILSFWLNRTRLGLTLRAVSVNPEASGLVGIDVPNISALAFGLGGAVTAVGGSLLSMFLTFDASVGVIFTMKALVIVIMGGVRDIRGTILVAFILGLTETAVASLIDPGLTLAAAYLLFILILLFRPEGIFGKRST